MVAGSVSISATGSHIFDIGGLHKVELLQRDFQGTVRVAGMQDQVGDGTGTRVWPTALPLLLYMQGLCPQMQQSLEITRPLRILELGAGCGLLGVGLAATCGA